MILGAKLSSNPGAEAGISSRQTLKMSGIELSVDFKLVTSKNGFVPGLETNLVELGLILANFCLNFSNSSCSLANF